MIANLRVLSAKIRWKDWGPAKLPFLLGVCFYAALAGRHFTLHTVCDCLLFGLLAAVSSIYGYLINDLGDMETDRRQGKPNTFAGWSRLRAGALAAGLAALSTVLAIPWLLRPGFAVLWLVWLLVTTGYSLPPLRLKERSWLGLVAPAVAQQLLPVLLACGAFGLLGQADAWLIGVYAFSKGMALILIHQRRDLAGDSQSGARTFAVRWGERVVTPAAQAAIELEKALFWAPLALAVRAGPTWTLAGSAVSLTWPLLLLYAPIHVLSVREGWLAWRRGCLVDPYHTNPFGSATGLACVVWPTMAFPVYLAVLLTVFFPPAVLLLAVCVLLYGTYAAKAIQTVTRYRALRAGYSPTRGRGGQG